VIRQALALEGVGMRIKQRGSVLSQMRLWTPLLLAESISFLLIGLTSCQPENISGNRQILNQPTSSVEDLESARKAFITKLRFLGPAPQPYRSEIPPRGVRQVEYTSTDLKLKGWLSEDAGDSKKRPAVVYLHGGWSFGAADWQDAEPFAKSGFVLFMPMLRGENGNPGIHESFLGEVDDAIAAGRYVSSLPNVDTKKVFIVGHSVGGILTTLVSMLPSPYKAAAAFDGYLDMESWAATLPDAYVPYDRNVHEEVRIRNPMAFATSIRLPLMLYVGESRQVNERFATKAQQAGKDCKLITVLGNHQAMVAPAVQRSILAFQQMTAK
jgi:dipeptidyl aminopeptidase/acylaminoacyl peptidase